MVRPSALETLHIRVGRCTGSSTGRLQGKDWVDTVTAAPSVDTVEHGDELTRKTTTAKVCFNSSCQINATGIVLDDDGWEYIWVDDARGIPLQAGPVSAVGSYRRLSGQLLTEFDSFLGRTSVTEIESGVNYIPRAPFTKIPIRVLVEHCSTAMNSPGRRRQRRFASIHHVRSMRLVLCWMMMDGSTSGLTMLGGFHCRSVAPRSLSLTCKLRGRSKRLASLGNLALGGSLPPSLPGLCTKAR